MEIGKFALLNTNHSGQLICNVFGSLQITFGRLQITFQNLPKNPFFGLHQFLEKF